MTISPRYPEYLDALMMQAALVDDFLPRDLLARVLPGLAGLGGGFRAGAEELPKD